MDHCDFACVVGARPNFMKMAPILRALSRYPAARTTLIHTGQHYDAELSGIFFDELGLRKPDCDLEVGSGSQGAQTARILERMEDLLERGTAFGKPFDRMIVVGDVNSTMASALAAAKGGVPIAHVEAGLRSFDRSMPEEINRIVTDSVTDIFLTSEPAGTRNLLREGHPADRLHLVGNVMIDTLMDSLPAARRRGTLRQVGVRAGHYGVVTLHRPANVDDPLVLASLIDGLCSAAAELPMVFPVHPRTKHRLQRFDLDIRLKHAANALVLPPLGYLDFLALTSQAKVIITDSGGLQEESTALGIPCLTLRSTTERPITVEQGTCTLIGNDVGKLGDCLRQVLNGSYRVGERPQLWDGHAAERIARVLMGDEIGAPTTANRRVGAGPPRDSCDTLTSRRD